MYKRFIVGIDRAKMRLYDCEQSAQNDILDSGKEKEYNYEEERKNYKGIELIKKIDGYNLFLMEKKIYQKKIARNN